MADMKFLDDANKTTELVSYWNYYFVTTVALLHCMIKIRQSSVSSKFNIVKYFNYLTSTFLVNIKKAGISFIFSFVL